jgi:hypothetical protein
MLDGDAIVAGHSSPRSGELVLQAWQTEFMRRVARQAIASARLC